MKLLDYKPMVYLNCLIQDPRFHYTIEEYEQVKHQRSRWDPYKTAIATATTTAVLRRDMFKYIQFIKYIREQSGWGLKMVKDLVDQYLQETPKLFTYYEIE